MSLLENPANREERGSRMPWVLGSAALLIVVALGAWWVLRPAPAPVSPQASRPSPAPPPSTAPVSSAPETTPAESPSDVRVRTKPVPKKAEPPAVASEGSASVPGPELHVDTDVEGALVFLDRKFLGNAPVKTTEVTGGTHQLNVSAEGYDGVARTIEIAESGPTTVTVRLKDVRLNESVDVVHKHGMGSCLGRLSADLSGFRYAPAKGDDAFTLAFDAVESFDIDYLKKTLRIRRKGGKTWNFESPTGSADPLFVFHREVEKARAKLSAAR